MTYQEKKIWVSLATTVILLCVYVLRLMNVMRINGQDIMLDGQYWARTILIFIAVTIGIMILIQIIAHIIMAFTHETKKAIHKHLGEKDEMVNLEDYFEKSDEMDHLIELKSNDIGYKVFGIGFLVAIMFFAFYNAVGIMLNICFVFFMIGTVVESILRLRLYKRGVYNG